jgi:hypothetical protein
MDSEIKQIRQQKITTVMLRAEGYVWNGDDASDDLPFVTDTAHGPIVIMPRTNTPQNDLTMWLAPRNPPSILWEGFRNTFETLYAEGEAGHPNGWRLRSIAISQVDQHCSPSSDNASISPKRTTVSGLRAVVISPLGR